MYKILVVDDEYLVRTGITETIDWTSHGIKVVGTAVNGEDALEKIQQLKPDIILSDIKMPVMDGMQLVEALYNKGYDGIIVMLSGYNDFEYAKSTLEKGVFKYLLKPIDNDELLSAVLQAAEKLAKRRKMESIMSDVSVGISVIKNSLTDSVFHGTYDRNTIHDKLSLYDLPYINRGVVLYCKADVSADGDEKVRQALDCVEKEIENILAEYQTISSHSDKRVAFATSLTDADALEKSLVDMFCRYEKQHKVLMSVGISEIFDNFDKIPAAFSVAKFIAGNRAYAINGVKVARPGDEQNRAYRRYIADALKYISEHYGDPELKIKNVADSLYISESHLMHLFKQELKKTFNTCLTEYRIMIAKKLLAEEKYKVFEVGEMVGYIDMKYFGQVFRKLVGTTPGDYVKQRNEKKS